MSTHEGETWLVLGLAAVELRTVSLKTHQRQLLLVRLLNGAQVINDGYGSMTIRSLLVTLYSILILPLKIIPVILSTMNTGTMRCRGWFLVGVQLINASIVRRVSSLHIAL